MNMGQSDRLARQSYPDLPEPVMHSPNKVIKMGDHKILRSPTTEVHDIQTLMVCVLTLQRNCFFELNSHSARQQTASNSPPDAVILHPHILFNTILPSTTRFTNWSLPLYICMIYLHYLYYSSYAIPHYEILFPTSFHILPIWPEHSAQKLISHSTNAHFFNVTKKKSECTYKLTFRFPDSRWKKQKILE